MGTWYGNRLVSIGDDVWFYKFGTTINGPYAAKSGQFGNCHGKVTNLYGSEYPWSIGISGTITAGTGGTFTGCTVKPGDLNWGYQNWITYNGNGGTVSAAHQTGYVGASLTGKATRTGYTFAGWYSASSGGSKYTTIPNSNGYTFYAHWTANKYTVTLNNNGATTAGTASVSATYASAMPAITKPTKTGYTFGGYYYGSTQYYTAAGASARSYDYAGARTLTAKWTANTYTVKFNGNGSTSGSMSNESFTYGVTEALPTNGFSRGAAYVFTGWNTAPDGTGTAVAANYSASKLTATNGGTVTLYAQWELQYLAPTINDVLAQRYENGAEDDEGTCVHVEFDWEIDLIVSSANYATSVKIQYREQGTQSWTTLQNTTYSGQSASSISGSVSYTSATGVIDTDKTYDILISVTDQYGTSISISAPQATATTFISTAFFTLDFADGGHGMGIGAPAPATGLKIGMDTEFTGDLNGAHAAIGEGTVSTGDDQTSVGRYNTANSSFAFMVGNGTADNDRSNAFRVNWNGNCTAGKNLYASNDVEDGSGNVLSAVAATANAVKSTTDKKIKNTTVKYVKKTVSIAAGSSTSAKTTTVNFTASERNNGSIINVIACMGANQLPYINVASKLFTWISNVSTTSVTISNTAGAWSGYDTYFILFLENTT